MAKFGVYFSSAFGIKPDWMEKNGVFDPTLDVDAPLFLDPFLLANSRHKEFSECAWDKYEAHIGEIFALLRLSTAEDDKAWKGALRKFTLGELRGLHGIGLGYSKRSTRGRGMGPVLALRSLRWADAVIKMGVRDPELFSSLPLFEDGIGADLISDMIANISLECILRFNERIYKEIEETGVKIPRKRMQVGDRYAMLPQNPFDNMPSPVILLPDDVLKYLPLMSDPLQLQNYAETNADVRDRTNAHFSEIFKIRYKKEKEELKRKAMKNAQAFQALLDILKLMENKHYDVHADPEGLLIWSAIAEKFTSLHKKKIDDDAKLGEQERIDKVAIQIIDQFRSLVEDNRLYQVFYYNGKPRHERFAQLLFFAIAVSYCEANNLDVSPESDAGAGPVDFKLSRGTKKVVVEIKLSTNGKVVSGYKSQIAAYQKAERAVKGHYVVIDVGQIGNKWKNLTLLQAGSKDFAKVKSIHLINAIPKASASKLN